MKFYQIIRFDPVNAADTIIVVEDHIPGHTDVLAKYKMEMIFGRLSYQNGLYCSGLQESESMSFSVQLNLYTPVIIEYQAILVDSKMS